MSSLASSASSSSSSSSVAVPMEQKLSKKRRAESSPEHIRQDDGSARPAVFDRGFNLFNSAGMVAAAMAGLSKSERHAVLSQVALADGLRVVYDNSPRTALPPVRELYSQVASRQTKSERVQPSSPAPKSKPTPKAPAAQKAALGAESSKNERKQVEKKEKRAQGSRIFKNSLSEEDKKIFAQAEHLVNQAKLECKGEALKAGVEKLDDKHSSVVRLKALIGDLYSLRSSFLSKKVKGNKSEKREIVMQDEGTDKSV